MYRQGDVIIKKVPQIKGNKLRHLTLAEGEMTGHAHKITDGEAELYEHEGTLYLKVKSDKATLTHEEHKKVELPKGDFEIKIQREYSPEGWRNVAD